MEKMVLKNEVHADILANLDRKLKFEEGEEEFCSCCGDDDDDDDWTETEDSIKDDLYGTLRESSVRILFKGVSISNIDESGISGIGVVIERPSNQPIIQLQKKLNFYVEESVADYLALMDGLVEATKHENFKRVFAFTDSEFLHNQISRGEVHDNPLLTALKERILEHVRKVETFNLKLVPAINLEQALKLAQVAIGIVSLPTEENMSLKDCSMCCEEKASQMMMKMKCCHKFCTRCIKAYVNGKVKSSQVPIRCPQTGCKYYISNAECKAFLPVACYESLERELANCSVSIDPEYEFCYSCGVEFRDSQCQCACWTQSRESEQWAWESFQSYYPDQERSELELIQRFLAGFGLGDHSPLNQSLPHCMDSYVETMKDLHQLPWLERFVSVINDDYYDDYVQ